MGKGQGLGCPEETKPRPPAYLCVILTEASDAREAEGSRTASRKRSRHRFQVSACHPDRSEQRSRSRRISDSFAQTKPVPVPRLRIQFPSSLSEVERSPRSDALLLLLDPLFFQG